MWVCDPLFPHGRGERKEEKTKKKRAAEKRCAALSFAVCIARARVKYDENVRSQVSVQRVRMRLGAFGHR